MEEEIWGLQIWDFISADLILISKLAWYKQGFWDELYKVVQNILFLSAIVRNGEGMCKILDSLNLDNYYNLNNKWWIKINRKNSHLNVLLNFNVWFDR